MTQIPPNYSKSHNLTLSLAMSIGELFMYSRNLLFDGIQQFTNMTGKSSQWTVSSASSILILESVL
jgi:hypothetical protein